MYRDSPRGSINYRSLWPKSIWLLCSVAACTLKDTRGLKRWRPTRYKLSNLIELIRHETHTPKGGETGAEGAARFIPLILGAGNQSGAPVSANYAQLSREWAGVFFTRRGSSFIAALGGAESALFSITDGVPYTGRRTDIT